MGFLILAALSYLPALNSLHWFLRVGVPEIGLIFSLPAIPAALWLSRGYPKAALGISALLVLLLAVPWVQAVGVAQQLSDGGLKPFTEAPDRFPLLLGDRAGIQMSTEEYKPGLAWDRYTPATVEPRATFLFVHGGSWRNGTRKQYPQMFRYLAGRGYEVLSITYTLSGTAPYPAAPHDLQAAIDKAAELQRPLFLSGRSSGGHLALLAAYTNPDKVKGVIGIYSPVDMKWSYDHPSNPNVLDSREAIVEFLTKTPEQDPELYREASPIDRVGVQGPPTLLIHGRADCLVYHKQSEMLLARLRELKVDAALLSMPWTEHGGDVTIYGPTGRLAVWAMECFMESRIKK